MVPFERKGRFIDIYFFIIVCFFLEFSSKDCAQSCFLTISGEFLNKICIVYYPKVISSN